jgi:polyisoprenoid-binding protein YceI
MRMLLAIAMAVELAVGLAGPARAWSVYDFDQRHGSISFAVDHLGLFTSHGRFQHFAGRLRFDPDRPEATRVDVVIEAGSVAISPDEARTMLRSPDYFDVAHHGDIRFRSTGVTQLGPAHFILAGQLEIRGVTRMQALDVVLAGRHVDKQGNDVADVVATGGLRRSAFGMLADRSFVDDKVMLRILMRVELGHGGSTG